MLCGMSGHLRFSEPLAVPSPVTVLAYSPRRLRRSELKSGRGNSQRRSQPIFEFWRRVAFPSFDQGDVRLIDSDSGGQLFLRERWLAALSGFSNRELCHTT